MMKYYIKRDAIRPFGSAGEAVIIYMGKPTIYHKHRPCTQNMGRDHFHMVCPLCRSVG